MPKYSFNELKSCHIKWLIPVYGGSNAAIIQTGVNRGKDDFLQVFEGEKCLNSKNGTEVEIACFYFCIILFKLKG